MRAEREMVIDNFGEVQLAEVSQRLGEVVDDEPVSVGEVFISHLRHLPTRKVEVQAVDERHVVTDSRLA
jgi:hypothetical protein